VIFAPLIVGVLFSPQFAARAAKQQEFINLQLHYGLFSTIDFFVSISVWIVGYR